MFPIGDTDIRPRRTAFITIALVVINTIIFIYEFTLSQPALDSLFSQYAVIPTNILAGNHLLTLFTSMFLHGGWLHLIGNMLFLWVFGDNVEAVLGHIGYLIFYLIGGIVASLSHVLMNSTSTLPSLGASGAIAAVLGAYIVMFPRSQVRVLIFYGIGFWVTRVTAIFFLGIWIITQLFNGFASLGVPTSQTSGVAVWAHVGGFVLGFIIGLVFRGRAQNLQYRAGDYST
ncbi:MAG: rhomboid family intramembrane serine protease [Omnitrophica WOR_2 bacterium]